MASLEKTAVFRTKNAPLRTGWRSLNTTAAIQLMQMAVIEKKDGDR
jgi:hypothetical protein